MKFHLFPARRVFLSAICLAASICVASACDNCSFHNHGPTSGSSGGNAAASDPAPIPPQGPAALGGAGSFRFGVVGDTQGLQFLSQLITDMNAHNPELVVFPGDLVSTGSISSWNQWDALSQHFIGGPNNRLMVPGNHDLPVGGDVQWQQTFNWLPDSQTVGGVTGINQMDYYVDHGNSRFVSITTDSQANGAGGPPAAQQWLENLMAEPSTQAMDHVFVYSHHPITFNNYDGTGGTAGPWWQAMAQNDAVDGVFVGHWHQYQPSQPDPHSNTWEVISGTGNTGFSGHPWQNRIGYTIVEVDGPRVLSRFYGDADGDGSYDDLLDEFIMTDSVPRPTGVVGYYGFHDPTQNVDAAPAPLGRGNTGAYIGNAVTVAGPLNGPALSLDGSGDYAHGGAISDYNLAILRDLTISINANYDVLSSGPSENTLVSYTADVAGYTDREEAVNQPYNLRIRDDRRLEMMWEHNNNVRELFVSTEIANITANGWHEYRVTRDATLGELTFYVDGVQLGDVLLFDPLTELPTGGAQGYLRIGINYDRDNPAKLVGAFDGLVDELVIWNEVTTAAFIPPDLPCDLFADLTGDCQLDVDDWIQFRGGQHVNMTGLTSEEAMALGDLNGDFRNDHADFVLFKNAYEVTNGQGSFAAMLNAVPESSTVVLLAGALSTLLVARWRNRPV